jgi:type III restriction enzyme
MSEVGGIDAASLAAIRALCERSPGLERLWLFGSRAAGTQRANSDLDLLVDAPDWSATDCARFETDLAALPMVYPVDLAWWQGNLSDAFRAAITRQRRPLWEPFVPSVDTRVPGLQLKRFQEQVLEQLAHYLELLKQQAGQSHAALQALRGLPGMEAAVREAADFPKATWAVLRTQGRLPPSYAAIPYSSRFDGAGRPVPNVCLKLPTGGGKTLLAAASIGQLMSRWLERHTGLVLWVVPNDAIYQQTLKTLNDRDHPYRQLLNLAGAGRVKILEKNAALTRADVDSHLCVMVLMLASAARQSKEQLRFFRDRGNVLGFLPRDDDFEAHHQLLKAVPNLDAYGDGNRDQLGAIVKSSLGNVCRLLRPIVVIDEGHHGYTENALRTLDGFNPSFLLELSATPRVAASGGGSNILTDVRGRQLEEAGMIKLPIHVDVQHWSDWQACLAAALLQLDRLQRDAEAWAAEGGDYIRPILLVQVERTGNDTRESGYIHADDAQAYLLQLGLQAGEIAIKTSHQNDLQAPENQDLLSPSNRVRAIITKQALQEGWDCPFAYVLCALAAARNTGAMTQLVGRVLRQPRARKTGRELLDACYVLCHDAHTGKVVDGIKKALEDEGLGDLTLKLNAPPGEAAAPLLTLRRERREHLRGVRLFLPRVSWNEPDGSRRELVYESDVLAQVDWSDVDAAGWVRDWAPDAQAALAERFQIGLDGLGPNPLFQPTQRVEVDSLAEVRLDRARVARALLDLAPNPWWTWDWVQQAVQALLARGLTERQLAASSASLIERLRIQLERRRDALAQAVFEREVAAGRIRFALRADASDYELPHEELLSVSAMPAQLVNSEGLPARRSLLEPAYRTADLNDFEAGVAGYLDSRQALAWWHRNVARQQYGLQGWRRHKVYPDFVFAKLAESDAPARWVLLETKGMQLMGNDDSGYKQALLVRLQAAFCDERQWQRVGELRLETSGRAEVEIECDLVVDANWQGTLAARWFGAARAD